MRSTAVCDPSAISHSSEWMRLSEAQQIELARQALQVAIGTLVAQAEVLAREMDDGCLIDRGGPDALRLLAKVMRLSSHPSTPTPPIPDLATMDVIGRA